MRTGCGVTLALAALAWGFQYGHFGLFLVAALSGLGFWRYCLRMREIEVLRCRQATNGTERELSTPRIDADRQSRAAALPQVIVDVVLK
jgi:hypothetical protein